VRYNSLALGLTLFLIPALPARADRVGVSLASGLFLPSMKEFREIYGSPIPLAFAVSWTKTSGLGFSLGIEYVDKSGRTLGDGGETLPLRFRMWTIPAAISFGYDLGWIRYAAGLGVSFNSYKETWEVAGLENLSSSSRRVGYLALLTVEVPFSSRFAALARVRYMTLSTNASSFLAQIVNLGGTSLHIGVSYSFAANIAVRVNPLRGIPRTLVRGGIENSPLRGQAAVFAVLMNRKRVVSALQGLQSLDPTDSKSVELQRSRKEES
jgi:hypothetical protein